MISGEADDLIPRWLPLASALTLAHGMIDRVFLPLNDRDVLEGLAALLGFELEGGAA